MKESTSIPSETCEKIVDLFSNAIRHGVEIGLRAMAKRCNAEGITLHVAIREMDKEFGFECPHPNWKNGLCERCGCKDPLGGRQPGDDSP